MWDTFIDWLQNTAVDVGLTIAWAIAWLAGSMWLARIASERVTETLSRRAVEWDGAVLASRLVSIAIRVAGVLIALTVLGVPGTGLLAVVSAFTVAIGLSLQDVMRNFFAGVYMLLERPFKVGDRITVKGVVGEVQGIDLRTTIVKAESNEMVLIPNATVFTEVIRNETRYTVRRLEFTVKTKTRTLEQVEELVKTRLAGSKLVHGTGPNARIVSRGDDLLTISVAILVENTNEAQNSVTQAVLDALPNDSVEVGTT